MRPARLRAFDANAEPCGYLAILAASTGNLPAGSACAKVSKRACDPRDILIPIASYRLGSADPERDCYPFNPADLVRVRRADFLLAAFIAMRAFRLAGMPRQELPAVGSFDDWSRRVRDLVYWLTAYDVSEGFRQNKEEDPRRQNDASLLAALHQKFGTKPFKGTDAIAVHVKFAAPHSSWTESERALHDALDEVLGSRGVNAKLFGYWARRLNGAHIGGFLLETKHDPATNANVITVRRT
jgi:hypothetical protein